MLLLLHSKSGLRIPHFGGSSSLFGRSDCESCSDRYLCPIAAAESTLGRLLGDLQGVIRDLGAVGYRGLLAREGHRQQQRTGTSMARVIQSWLRRSLPEEAILRAISECGGSVFEGKETADRGVEMDLADQQWTREQVSPQLSHSMPVMRQLQCQDGETRTFRLIFHVHARKVLQHQYATLLMQDLNALSMQLNAFLRDGSFTLPGEDATGLFGLIRRAVVERVTLSRKEIVDLHQQKGIDHKRAERGLRRATTPIEEAGQDVQRLSELLAQGDDDEGSIASQLEGARQAQASAKEDHAAKLEEVATLRGELRILGEFLSSVPEDDVAAQLAAFLKPTPELGEVAHAQCSGVQQMVGSLMGEGKTLEQFEDALAAELRRLSEAVKQLEQAPENEVTDWGRQVVGYERVLEDDERHGIAQALGLVANSSQEAARLICSSSEAMARLTAPAATGSEEGS